MNGDALMQAMCEKQATTLHAAEGMDWRVLYRVVADADAEALALIVTAGLVHLHHADVRIAWAAIAMALAATEAEPGSEPDPLDPERRVALATLLVARRCGAGSCQWRIGDVIEEQRP
jgi:hypothetical protein